jgi:hypothetical protein
VRNPREARDDHAEGHSACASYSWRACVGELVGVRICPRLSIRGSPLDLCVASLAAPFVSFLVRHSRCLGASKARLSILSKDYLTYLCRVCPVPETFQEDRHSDACTCWREQRSTLFSLKNALHVVVAFLFCKFVSRLNCFTRPLRLCT